jgi:predicted small lipoprotein YifL
MRYTHYQAIATAILAAALSQLGGCGQTGPLYLPEAKEPSGGPEVQSETTDPGQIPPL